MRFLILIMTLIILSSCSEEEKVRVIEINHWTTQQELNSFRQELDDVEVFEGDIAIGHLIKDINSYHFTGYEIIQACD